MGACGFLLEGRFEFFEDFVASVDDCFRDTGEFGDVNAIAFVGSAGEDFVEEDDFVLPFAYGNVAVFDVGEELGEFCYFVVVSCEECSAFEVCCDVLGDCPGESESVVGACSASDFVEYDERFFCGVVDYICGFRHFDHEG